MHLLQVLVEGFAKYVAPLHQLTEPETTFASKQVHEEAFRKLKSALRSGEISAYSDGTGDFNKSLSIYNKVFSNQT